MKAKKRREEIIRVVEERKKVSISSLSKLLKTREGTIRRDVWELERENKIKREHGFAVYQPEIILPKFLIDFDSFPFYIGEIAAAAINKCIKEKKMIWLGDGDISCEVARQIKNVSLVTNSLKIAIIAAKSPSNSVKIKLLGDYLDNESLILNGSSLFDGLGVYNVDTVFFEPDGFDTEIVTANADKADILKKIKKKKEGKTIALLQPDFFGKESEKTVCKIKSFDLIITSDQGNIDDLKSELSGKKELLILAPSKVTHIADRYKKSG